MQILREEFHYFCDNSKFMILISKLIKVLNSNNNNCIQNKGVREKQQTTNTEYYHIISEQIRENISIIF